MSTPSTPTIPYDYQRDGIDDATLLMLYERMLKPRMIEEKMLILFVKEKSVSGLAE